MCREVSEEGYSDAEGLNSCGCIVKFIEIKFYKYIKVKFDKSA